MSGEACPRGRGGPFEAIGTTVRVLRATSHVVGRASQSLGALAHALGRTTQVVGNCRPCLRSMFRSGGLQLLRSLPYVFERSLRSRAVLEPAK